MKKTKSRTIETYRISKQRNCFEEHYSIFVNNDFLHEYFDTYEDAKLYAQENLEPDGYIEK